jgi:hypothetical protein
VERLAFLTTNIFAFFPSDLISISWSLPSLSKGLGGKFSAEVKL